MAQRTWDVAASGLAAATLFLAIWMAAGAALGLLVMSSAPAIVLSFLIPLGIGGRRQRHPGRRARPAVDRSRDGGQPS